MKTSIFFCIFLNLLVINILFGGDPISSKVEMYKGRPTIFINGKAELPIIYALTDVPGGRWSWEEIPQANIKLYCETGVKIFQVDVFLQHIWKEDGTMDYSIPLKQIRGITEVCPNANVMFRFHVNAPPFWFDKNPDEAVVYDSLGTPYYSPNVKYGVVQRLLDGDARATKRVSLASEKWKTEISAKVNQFLREFSKYPEANHLAIIQIACGVYGEWHYWGFNGRDPDLSQAMNDKFREFALKKYVTDASLKKAWNDKNITFNTIQVPNSTERAVTGDYVFRNPMTDRKVIDYYECQHNVVADDIIHFNKLVKENWPRPIITGSFYGYYFSVFHRQAAGGHLAVQKILKSPYVDFLSGPQVYYPDTKDGGQPYRSRSLITSMRLNGKLWLDEYDQQPVRVFPFADGTRDNRVKFDSVMHNNRSEFVRSLMSTHAKGMGYWLYDFGPGTQVVESRSEYSTQAGNNNGWWEHPAFSEAMRTIIGINRKMQETEYESDADVLMVFDTDAFYYLRSVNGGDPVTHPLLDWTTLATYYSSVVFDPIHIDDLEKVNPAKYKAIVFVNTFLMSEGKRKYITEQLAQNGRNLIFFYAPGYTDGTVNNLKYMNEVTGMEFEKAMNITPNITPKNEFEKFGELGPWGKCENIFHVTDKKAITLGVYKGSNKVGIAKKKLANATSWYIGMPVMDYKIMQEVYKQSGCTMYSTEKDIIYSGSGFTVFHTGKGGKKSIKIPGGKTIEINLPTNKQATVVLDSKTGEVLYK
ncbi:MAG: hypothetical protein SFY32_00790 [Bacteroidota bacterium]|nr:hypothetical protein [Bacteroidota bacterium]